MQEPIINYRAGKIVDVHSHTRRPDSLTVYQADIEDAFEDGMLYSLGIHPLQKSDNSVVFLTQLDGQLQHPDCVAIGESGLDKNSIVPLETQQELFRAQMELSVKHQLPVIIHCVGRWNELELLFKEKIAGSPEWIIHGFRKTKLAQKFLDLGACLSFGKALLYDKHLQELVPHLPMERIFLETDDEAFDIQLLYDKLAELKSLPLQTITEQVYANFNRVFYRNPLEKNNIQHNDKLA